MCILMPIHFGKAGLAFPFMVLVLNLSFTFRSCTSVMDAGLSSCRYLSNN